MKKNTKEIKRCPHCSRHCLLSEPRCHKGRDYVKKLKKNNEKEKNKTMTDNIDLRKKELPKRENEILQLLSFNSKVIYVKNKDKVLMYLYENGKVNKADLKQKVSDTKEYKGILKKLKNKEYIIINKDKQQTIYLTQKGNRIAEKVSGIYYKKIKKYFMALTDQEKINLETLLRKLLSIKEK